MKSILMMNDLIHRPLLEMLIVSKVCSTDRYSIVRGQRFDFMSSLLSLVTRGSLVLFMITCINCLCVIAACCIRFNVIAFTIT